MTSTTTDRRFAVNAGAAIKVPCIAATTTNITLSGEQTIDGIACVTNDRVLVKNQTTASENGIYYVDTSSWKRAADFNDVKDVVEGTIIPVNRGTTNSDTAWRVTNTGTITPGTTSLTFEDAAFSDSASIAFLQSGTGATSRTVQSVLRERIRVTDFGADPTGAASSVAAFQAAVDSTANSGLQRIYVPGGTYLGDMTTLTYGSRYVIFVEDGGPVTYSTAAPYNRNYSTTTGLFRVDYRSTSVYNPFGIRSEYDVYNAGGAGNKWAMLSTVNLRETTGTNDISGMVVRAINHGTSDDNCRAIDAVGRDTTEGSVEYGSPYPVTPVSHDGAVISYEGNTFRTNVFDDSGKRGIGIQLTAGGGTECANGIEIAATQNTAANTHSGTLQTAFSGFATLAADANPNTGYYIDSLITILAGTGAGQVRKITAYNGATKVASIDTSWTTVPDNTSEYLVYDSYWTGLWRRGIKIFQNALNKLEGTGFQVDADCNVGYLMSGESNSYDYAISRTTANRAKINYTVGNTSGAIYTETYRAGDSASASADVLYGQIQCVITDNTTTTHAGEVRIEPVNAGTTNSAYYLRVGNGVYLGNATGGYKGAGTLNVAGDIYKNNTAYTNPDYVFEYAYTGKIEKFAENPGASEYDGFKSIDEIEKITMETLKLPGFDNEPKGIFERGDLILEKLEEAYLCIFELNKRVKELESK